MTGSGKTEVYLRAAEAALAQGRSAIVMVPEIALTPQTARRFEERFGERVAILHSKLGLGERYDEWRRLRDGRARICVGPRSAVFAPLRDLGLVVVDEEHDSAYKQESDPRYDAREVAERRARQAGAVLVCGSATPRPESWLRLSRLSLPERVDGLGLPPVELLDMRGLRHALHPDARRALEDVRRRGRKAIVLVNRRGWSAFVECRECGRGMDVPALRRDAHSAPRLRARARSRAITAATRSPRRTCAPSCGSSAVARHGAGTQRVEAELREALTPLPVFRLDADSARRKHGIAETLDRFARADAGVLVGTQMVAQGHDFPEVELAIVQDADATLRFPDFRAEERTFALVSQLAGRSGRGPGGGRVMVQTLSPHTSCLRHAASHDAAGIPGRGDRAAPRAALSAFLYADRRDRLGACAGRRGSRGGRGRAALLGLNVLGPAPLFRLKDMFRSRVLMKAQDRPAAVAAVGAAVQRGGGRPFAAGA